MARPNMRLARLRARRKQAVWSPALTSAVPATHSATFSKSNKIAAYLASKITSTLTVRPIVYFYLVATAYTQAIFTALVSIPNYRSSGIITYAHENVTSDEQRLVSWIRHINLKGALRLLSHAKLKERQWHCGQIVVNFAEISSVITNSLTNSWSACDYATFGGRVHVAPARLLMLSGVYSDRLSTIHRTSQYEMVGRTTQDMARVPKFAALTEVLSTGSPRPIEFYEQIIEHAGQLLGQMKPTLAPDLHDNNDKLIFAIQRQIFFATYYRLANLGRIIPLQMAKRNTLRISVFARDMQEIQYGPAGKKIIYFVPDVAQSDVAKTDPTSTKDRFHRAHRCAFNNKRGAFPSQQCPIVLSDEHKRKQVAPLNQLLSVMGDLGALCIVAARSQYTCKQLKIFTTACGVYATSSESVRLDAQNSRDHTWAYNLVKDVQDIQYPNFKLSAQFICTSTSIRRLQKDASVPAIYDHSLARRASMQMYTTTREDIRHYNPHLALFGHQRDAGDQLPMGGGTQNVHQGSHLPVYKDKESNSSITKPILLIEDISLRWNVHANMARSILRELRMAELSIRPIDHIAVSLLSTSSKLAMTLHVRSRKSVFQRYDYIEAAEGKLCALRVCQSQITALKVHPHIYSWSAKDKERIGLISQGAHNLNALDTIRLFFRKYLARKHKPTRQQLLGQTIHEPSSTELHDLATRSVPISSSYTARYYYQNEVCKRLSPTCRIQGALGLILQPQSVCTSHDRKVIVSTKKKLSSALSQYMVDTFASLLLHRLFPENIKIVHDFTVECGTHRPCDW